MSTKWNKRAFNRTEFKSARMRVTKFLGLTFPCNLSSIFRQRFSRGGEAWGCSPRARARARASIDNVPSHMEKLSYDYNR